MDRIENIPTRTQMLKFYNTVASSTDYQAVMYEPAHRKQTEQRIKQVLSCVLPFTPKVLEVGCADGYISQWIAPRVDKLVGIDIVPVCIDRCKALELDNAKFRVVDANVMEEARLGKFDLVVATDVVEHLIDPLGFVKTAAKMGRVILATTSINESPNPDAFSVRAYNRPAKIGDGSGHIWSFRQNTFLDLFEDVYYYDDNGVTAVVLGR